MPSEQLTVLDDIRGIRVANEQLVAEVQKLNALLLELINSNTPKVVGISVTPGTPTQH